MSLLPVGLLPDINTVPIPIYGRLINLPLPVLMRRCAALVKTSTGNILQEKTRELPEIITTLLAGDTLNKEASLFKEAFSKFKAP